jgi:hypothetical protein
MKRTTVTYLWRRRACGGDGRTLPLPAGRRGRDEQLLVKGKCSFFARVSVLVAQPI